MTTDPNHGLYLQNCSADIGDLATPVRLVGSTPFIRGMVRETVELREVAAKHDATTFDVSLAWLLSKANVAALPHTTDEAHMRANLDAVSLEIDRADVETTDAIDREWRANDGRVDPWNQP